MNRTEQNDFWIDENRLQPWVDEEFRSVLYAITHLYNFYLYLAWSTVPDIPNIALQYNSSEHWWDELFFYRHFKFSSNNGYRN